MGAVVACPGKQGRAELTAAASLDPKISEELRRSVAEIGALHPTRMLSWLLDEAAPTSTLQPPTRPLPGPIGTHGTRMPTPVDHHGLATTPTRPSASQAHTCTGAAPRGGPGRPHVGAGRPDRPSGTAAEPAALARGLARSWRTATSPIDGCGVAKRVRAEALLVVVRLQDEGRKSGVYWSEVDTRDGCRRGLVAWDPGRGRERGWLLAGQLPPLTST